MNPNGSASIDYFEYGRTTSYGSVASAGSTNDGDTYVAMSAVVDDLSPSTTYHYRLVAATANGTTYGQDETFETTHPYPEWGTYRGTTSQHAFINLHVPSSGTTIDHVSFGFGLSCARHSPLSYRITPSDISWPLNTADGLGFDQVFFDNQGTRYQVKGTFTTTGTVSGTISIFWRTRRYGTCRSGNVHWRAS
jgi:hypothetical protein